MSKQKWAAGQSEQARRTLGGLAPAERPTACPGP